MEELIIGLGVPRSGTRRLAKLLSLQPQVCADHERGPVMPCGGGVSDVNRVVRWIDNGCACLGSRRRPYVAQVGFQWVNVVRDLAEVYSATVICVRRDRDDVIESLVENMNGEVLHDESATATEFPTFEGMDIEEAWGEYYDRYYEDWTEEDWQFPVSNLDTKQGQGRILSKAGLPPDDRVYLNDE